MPKKSHVERQSKRSGYKRRKRNEVDAAAIVQYLVPAVHLLEPIDLVSTKMIASVILETCQRHELSMPTMINDYLR